MSPIRFGWPRNHYVWIVMSLVVTAFWMYDPTRAFNPIAFSIGAFMGCCIRFRGLDY